MPYVLRIVRALGRGWPLAALVVLGCLALGADVGEGQQKDICGCANDPNSLGDFDASNQATYPPGTTRTLVNAGGHNRITIPLPASGVLSFKSFAAPYTNFFGGCCDQRTDIVFVRNAANNPVTILSAGDVQIGPAVFLMVNGDDASSGSTGINGLGGLGGPGGFRGGDGAYHFINLAADGGEGFGPAGGPPGSGSPSLTNAGHGSFVGIPELLPLVGGTGGGGGGSSSNAVGCSAGGGGGGGGAVLVAANGTITVNGTISADGGTLGNPANGGCSSFGGSGSGGAIRLVANAIAGTGAIFARSGGSCAGCGDHPFNTKGMIRLEAFTNNLAGDHTDPPASRALAPGPLTSPITTAVAITRINGQTVPTPPQGVFGLTDLVLPAPGTVPIDIQTTGVPGGTTVQVTVKPRVGGGAVSQNAALSACDSTGVCTTSTAFDLPAGEFLVEARATYQTP
jgi:hypothetical protein